MSIARHHADWLRLVPYSGPFLSLPVLMEAFPQGLVVHDAEHARLLRLAYEEWDDSFQKKSFDPNIHDAWIRFVLTTTLEFDESLMAEGQAIPQTLHIEVPEHGELLKPDIVLNDPARKKARMLIKKYPRSQDLTSYVAGSRWKASPDTRMTELLHATCVRLGLVTNGEHWMLVDAPKGETTGYASWYASLWREEKITLQAFRSLLSMTRFFGVSDDETIEALLTKSTSNQQEVTEQLGIQVLRAVEVLIQSLDKADQDHGRELLEGVGETVLYESALNVMMRLVFLFCAEERELIPTKPFPVYEQNYSVSTISKQLREIADQHTEELLERRYDAWPRLLSAFRAVYGGLAHDDVYMPAYGGRLFDPDRFPFLEGRMQKTSWQDTESTPLPVNNRTVLHLLEALQLLQVKLPGGGVAEARRVSFLALDIEQIGHVYEGLLDHTAKRAVEPMLGLIGKKEPEVSLQILEQEREKGDKTFFDFLKGVCGSSRKWEKYLDTEIEDQQERRLRTACGNNEDLFERVSPFAGLLRDDTFEYPVVVPKGSVFVTAGTDRRSSGTHYTPRSLTEPIVRYTLEPLVYVGPAEGEPKEKWKLKSAAELLDLKICDMACGSGAFLVQAARYMSERLMEAWDAAKEEFPDVPGITPEGRPSTGKANESLIPDDPAEQTTYAMRIVAQRCLYGVDINPLATEMAKLSLWLLTLAKDKPFEFLDHAIRCGDSLIGLHDIEQLRHFSLKPYELDEPMFSGPWLDGVPEAIDLRLKLEDMASNTVEDVEAQEKLLKEAEDKIARLRCAADLLVAGEFWGEGTKDKQEKVRHAAVVSGHYVENGPTEEFEVKADEECRGQRLFHWPLEFPEVIVRRGGFDAFLGNPPFRSGSRISSDYSHNYITHLKQTFSTSLGNTDLVCYFLLRASEMLSDSGYFGLIATNSISQGDNRLSTLVPLLSKRICHWTIPNLVWPGTANLYVSLLGIAPQRFAGEVRLNDAQVVCINSFLTEESSNLDAEVLQASSNFAFKGVEFLGDGFKLDTEVGTKLFSKYSDTGIVKPWINGNDLTEGACLPRRFAIDFSDMSMREAQHYEDCFSIVEKTVKVSRSKDKRKARRERWWQYGEKAMGMRRAIANLQKALIRPFTSNTFFFEFVSTEYLFTNALIVVVTEDHSLFSVLNSTLHEAWARGQGSSLKMDFRYTPSKCFDTFPLPNGLEVLSNVGERYESQRGQIREERNEGMTKIYNRFHHYDEGSAGINKLRDLHVEMDQAVAMAYGWNDINLDHGFHETKQGIRFTISEPARREVLQRLLKLNHERYEEEVKQGLHDKKQKAKKVVAAKPKKPTSKQHAAMATLFDLDDDVLFPSSEHDTFLCGLACDLVSTEPGLPPNAYRDALVIAVGYQRHKRLLTGKDRSKFAKLCKTIPAASRTAARRVPWNDVKSVLTLRKAILVDLQSKVQRGAELDKVRKTYPAAGEELVSLILKAAAELRYLESRAHSDTSEEAVIIDDFEKDRLLMCGGST